MPEEPKPKTDDDKCVVTIENDATISPCRIGPLQDLKLWIGKYALHYGEKQAKTYFSELLGCDISDKVVSFLITEYLRATNGKF